MKKLTLLLALLVWAGTAFTQTKLWEKSAAGANYPTFMGTANTERGFATGTITLQPFAKVWEKSQAGANYPSFMGTANTERGMAFGTIGANDRMLLVDRKVSNFVYVLNAATGDSVGVLDSTGFAAAGLGTLKINDADISSNGVIFACGLTSGAGADTVFMVYKWTSETATMQVAVSYVTKIRLGDKFTVTGSTADNSLVIWAAGTGTSKVMKFTTTDNGATFTPNTITLTGAALGTTPAVCPNTTGTELFIKANGTYLKRYQANGTLVDSVSGSIIGTGSNALRYFEAGGKKYLAVYAYGATNENVRIIDITAGLANAILVGASSTLGAVSNGNGTGDLGIKVNGDNTVTVYVLATNNGIASYKVNPATYGSVDRMYLVDRKISNNVYVLNAATGDSVGVLDVTGFDAIASGTLKINDVDVSADGIIYACNLVVGTGSDTTFRIYQWSSESAQPKLAAAFTAKVRLGDKFTVTGSAADNSLAIWAVGASSTQVIKLTTADKGTTFTSTVLTLSGNGSGGGTPSISPNLTATELYIKAQGNNVKRYLINGTLVDSSSSSVIGTGSNALRYFEIGAKKYLAIYHTGAANENAKIFDVTTGLAGAALVATSPSMGSVGNSNATGDVSVKGNSDATENIYVLGTNNGIGAYKFAPPQQITVPVFNPPAGTYNSAFWVKITVNSPGAKIYYTLNGTTPDSAAASTASKLFVDSVKISSDSVTFKAIAYAAGMITSDVSSAVYKIVKLVVPPSDPLYPYWAKTQAAGTFPSTFSTGNYERGMAYGKVGGKDRLYVVARNGGTKIVVFDAMKGDSVGVMMPAASVTGGTFPLDFVDVSDDGVIFAGNMTTDISVSSFKLYRWNSESDSAKTVIDTVLSAVVGGRVGDIFSVFGKASDNTLKVFAAVSGMNKVVKFTTATKGASFTAQVITLANGNLGSVPSAALASDSSLYVKSYGRALYHYSAAGAVVDSISTGVVGTDVTAIKYFERLGKKYVMCYYPNDGPPYTDERISIVDVTVPSAAKLAFSSPSIGKQSNGNGTGAVAMLPLANDNFLAFIMGTNNGLAAFTNNASLVVSTLDTLFYGNTATLLKNPYGVGFIAGTNSYGDVGKYERFPLKKNDMLSGFKVHFAYKKIVGDPDTVNLVVKTVASSGKPDSTLVSVMIMADKIDTTKAGNTIILDYPIKVNGPVFIGFEFTTTANDTIAMYLDKDGQGDNANRVWEKFSDGGYNDFGSVFNPTFSWLIDTDLWIAAYYKKGTTTSVGKEEMMPQGYALAQNYPNPFNPATTIRFSLAVKANVTLTVFNLLGQRVTELVNGDLLSGVHAVSFNASHLASGVYFYRLEARGADGTQFTSVRKLMLLK